VATLVIAHRGASAEKPENTLAAFRRALALKADGIELDVQVTADGVPVVFHDASLRRLTGRAGRIPNLTWRELKRLRVAGTEPIPRLAEVLALARGQVLVQIELKRGTFVAPVVRAIRQVRAARWVILSSFETPLVRMAGKLAPKIPRLLISEKRGGAKEHLRRMAAAGAGGLSLDYKAVRSRAMVAAIHAGGGTLWCWTVNDATVARRLAGWGVDALVGDNPVLLRRVV
jgi:glycerophosphoryl diester phosphodiesterase